MLYINRCLIWIWYIACEIKEWNYNHFYDLMSYSKRIQENECYNSMHVKNKKQSNSHFSCDVRTSRRWRLWRTLRTPCVWSWRPCAWSNPSSRTASPIPPAPARRLRTSGGPPRGCWEIWSFWKVSRHTTRSADFCVFSFDSRYNLIYI